MEPTRSKGHYGQSSGSTAQGDLPPEQSVIPKPMSYANK